jgi:hypothetical protein
MPESTTPVASTTTTSAVFPEEFISAATDELLAAIDEEGAVVELVGSGPLAENGQFLDDFGPGGDSGCRVGRAPARR